MGRAPLAAEGPEEPVVFAEVQEALDRVPGIGERPLGICSRRGEVRVKLEREGTRRVFREAPVCEQRPLPSLDVDLREVELGKTPENRRRTLCRDRDAS